MNRPWWAYVLQWTVWGIVMSLVMGWLARNRLKSRPQADAKKLVHPASTLGIGIAGFVFFAGIAVLSNVYRNSTTTWWTTAGFLGFALMAVITIAEYFLARHEVSESGINYGTLLGRRGEMRWSELEQVRYSPLLNWFRLKSRTGQVAHISEMLIGLPEFARLVLQHVPPNSIEPSTKFLLEDLANRIQPQL